MATSGSGGNDFFFLGLASYGLYNAFLPLIRTTPLIQQNVLGNEKPETYIEVNGVKYYSHIDGKELSDLVKE